MDNERTKELNILELKTGPDQNGKGDNMSKKKPKTNKKKRVTGAKVFASFISFAAVAFIAGVVVVSLFIVSTIAQTPPISADDFIQNDSTIVLDASGNVIYDLGEKLIETVEYEDISQSLIDAFVSIEDSRFFEHNGFDLPRFTSAMLKNVMVTLQTMNLSFDGGGASTIDMQLVRNALLTEENVETGEVELPASSGLDGIRRKIKEIYYATLLNNESILDKKAIFQKYVNEIWFGSGNNTLGVEKAAMYYFDKSVSDLTLVESAFLAGVVNAPNLYSPYKSLTLATERTHTVLYYMNYHGYIDDYEYEQALKIPLENLFVQQSLTSEDAMPNQAYIDVVLDEVEALTGLNPATTPMIIQTAMNTELQSQLDLVQNREITNLDIRQVGNSPIQIAATVVENSTGEIIGIVGGYDYYGQRVFNRSYHGLYQPGSTAKPFISYAPAFEFLGYATSHTFLDGPYVWQGTNIQLNNWDNRYRGQVTLREAISQSYNTSAVLTYDAVNDKIGHSRYVDYVESIGFVSYANNLNAWFEAIDDSRQGNGRDALSAQFAIGGSDFYTNTQELAGATAMIMNGGDYVTPHTIREVTIVNTGQVIESPYKATPVLSEAAAYLTAKTMRDVVDDNRGIDATRYVSKSYTTYAKTGTSDWSSDDSAIYGVPAGSAKDRLLLTGTDKISIASWSGFDAEEINKKDGKSYFSNAEKNFQIQSRLNGFVLDILEDYYGPGQTIPQPSTVKEITHILGSFPYQSPIAGMNENLITSGLVKAEAASLVPATPPELDSLSNSSVSVESSRLNNVVNITFAKYPDEEKLIKAPDTIEMTSGNRTYTGKRLYDASWIFGPVRYQSDIILNGEIIETIQSDTETQQFTVPLNTFGTMEVCTYYTFELNTDAVSNKICHPVDLADISVRVPSFGTLDDLNYFANNYELKINVTYRNEANPNSYNRVLELNPNHQKKTVKVSEIYNKTWDAVIGDHEIVVNDIIGSSARNFYLSYRNYLNIDMPSSGNITKIVDSSGNPINSIRLSTYDGGKITLVTE